MTFEELNKLFRDRNRTLGSVESFTGGLFASNVTAIAGASHFFKGALVTYATEEKVRLLGIPYEMVDKYGVVSQEIAGEMAYRAKQLLSVDYCVSFTGNAGPEVMEDKPAGLVYIAVAAYDKVVSTPFQLQGTRKEVQDLAVSVACDLIRELMEQIEKNFKKIDF